MNLKQSNSTTGFAPFVASTILVDVSTPLDGFPSKLKDKVLYIIGEEPNSKFIAILGLAYPDTLAAVSRTVGAYTISIDTNLGQDNYIVSNTDILEHWLLIQLDDGFLKQDGIESLTIYLKDIP